MTKADLIVRGASFFRGRDLDNEMDFMAVKEGRIAGFGKDAEIDKWIDEKTVLREYARDQLIMPGFYDSHSHIMYAGILEKFPTFSECKSEDETARKVKAWSDAHPDEQWIFGFDWYHVYWGQEELPRKETLDKYLPDKAVFITDAEGHGAWVNSKAFELCGITKDTPDPDYGYFKRDENGELTGYVDETALGIMAETALDFPIEVEQSYIRNFMDTAKSCGIVAVNDMLPFYTMELGKYESFADLDRKGMLTMRIHAAASLFNDLDKVLANAKKYNSEMYQIPLLKVFFDGVPTTYTGLMLEPYIDNPSTKGHALCDLGKARKQILEAQARGMSVRIHCCGDGAAHEALNYYEEALATYGDTGSRHAVEHFETTIPEDIERTVRIGAIPSMQPDHMAMTERYAENPYLVRYNDRQKKFAWALKSFYDAGAHLAFGTDAPVTVLNPFVTIYRAVTRQANDGEPAGGWNPEQRMRMEDILHCYTLEGYYGVHREDELGTLETGKLADFIVLDQNLLTIPPEQIRDTNVLLTVVGGQAVYER
jgi:predicted amidohydrolase YtcJ